MYQYTIVNIYRDKYTYTFDTYEELLAHYYAKTEPYTLGCDPYCYVVGTISERSCKVR